MRNEDYFEYIKKKPFNEKLRAFGHACESMTRNSIDSARPGASKEYADWHRNKAKAQGERADFLFKNLIEEFERR